MTEPAIELTHPERTGRRLDAAVLALLRAGEAPLNVYDTAAPADEAQKVITVALPYVVFSPADPVDAGETYAGDTTSRDVEFDLMYVGASRVQAKAAGERAEARIHRRAPLPEAGLIRKVASTRIQQERAYTGPGGTTLFYGVSQFAVTF